MKTLIAIPCMDTMETEFVDCLLHLRPVGEVEIRLLKGTLIYDARNQITKYAIEKGGFDYVLWIDSDMTFEPDLMEKLMADIEGEEDGIKKDAVTGLCFGRRPPFKPCIFNRLEVKQEGKLITPIAENWFDYPRDQVFQIEACGFAALLTRMDMLEAMGIYGFPFYPTAGLGEDLTFCWHANKLDYKFWCDSRLKIGHIMRTVMDEETRDDIFARAAEE